MNQQLLLHCDCGKIQGQVRETTPLTGQRAVCYCDDCQTYAYFLDNKKVLDAHGGTEVYQVAPARITITQGQENLSCMRLSPKGLLRWYAGCCKTPIGNMLYRPKSPFFGLISTFLEPERKGDERDQLIGKVRGRIMGKFAVRNPPADLAKSIPVGLIANTVRVLAGNWWRNELQPSPFWSSDASGPVVSPTILTREERDRFRQKVPTGSLCAGA